MQILDKLYEFQSNIPRPLQLGLLGAGGLYFFNKFLSVTTSLYQNYIQWPLNLSQRYGPGSWALVTGAAGGIGQEWCKQLASYGFNVILTGRSESVDKLASSLQSQFPKVQFKVIKCDLQKINEALEIINNETSSLDISIVVNNAGIIDFTPFKVVTEQRVREMIDTNSVAPVLLAREFAPRLLAREKKSAMIFVSSLTGVYGFAYLAAYSATKFFVRGLALSLAEEFRGKIDVLAVSPSAVDTNMLPGKMAGTATPESCVYGSLTALGRRDQTLGAAKHNIMFGIASSLFDEGFIRSWGSKLGSNYH